MCYLGVRRFKVIANNPIRRQITAITTNVLGLVPSVLTVIVVIICAVTVEVAVTVSVYVPTGVLVNCLIVS